MLQIREKPENPASERSAIALYFLSAGTEDRVQPYLASGRNADSPRHFIRWPVGVRSVAARPIPGEWFDTGSVKLLQEAPEQFRE